MEDELSYLTTLSTDALLQELISKADTEPQFYSPASFKARVREVVGGLMDSARSLVCGRKDFLDSPELELASQLYGLLTGKLPEQMAGPFAVYAARVGVNQLCIDYPAR